LRSRGLIRLGCSGSTPAPPGKITNCQIDVFVRYACSRGRALIDRELYVPRSWFADRDRCAAAGVPADRQFATKPQLARVMIARAVAAGLPTGWVSGDEAYGDNGPLRVWLEDEQIRYVLAVACDHRAEVGAGKTIRADKLAANVPQRAWQRISCGPGSKGDRLYDWALADADRHPDSGRYLLVRRSISKGELAYYRCFAPGGATLAELVAVAGSRWNIEESFQGGKNEAALDHYQVRKHLTWYRHATLAMAAHAWLAVTAARAADTATAEPDKPPPEPAAATLACGDDPARERGPTACGQRTGDPETSDENIADSDSDDGELIPLTVNEIRRLHAIFNRPHHPLEHHERWSRWRRRHQLRARHCHYQRRRLKHC
jgi:SRSO17 transposase